VLPIATTLSCPKVRGIVTDHIARLVAKSTTPEPDSVEVVAPSKPWSGTDSPTVMSNADAFPAMVCATA
jgi:hypothetical protein